MSTKHAINKAQDRYAYFKIYISIEKTVLGRYMACYCFLHIQLNLGKHVYYFCAWL